LRPLLVLTDEKGLIIRQVQLIIPYTPGYTVTGGAGTQLQDTGRSSEAGATTMYVSVANPDLNRTLLYVFDVTAVVNQAISVRNGREGVLGATTLSPMSSQPVYTLEFPAMAGVSMAESELGACRLWVTEGGNGGGNIAGFKMGNCRTLDRAPYSFSGPVLARDRTSAAANRSEYMQATQSPLGWDQLQEVEDYYVAGLVMFPYEFATGMYAAVLKCQLVAGYECYIDIFQYHIRNGVVAQLQDLVSSVCSDPVSTLLGDEGTAPADTPCSSEGPEDVLASIRVPAGATSISYDPNNVRLVVAFNSASDEYLGASVAAGLFLEDRVFFVSYLLSSSPRFPPTAPLSHCPHGAPSAPLRGPMFPQYLPCRIGRVPSSRRIAHGSPPRPALAMCCCCVANPWGSASLTL
jgi:hypothetical protein